MAASKVDLLIIGAGPAGLMCANALAGTGIDVRIVDKRPVRVQAGHADGIHARTLEIFESYGLRERLFREGQQVHRAAFYDTSPDGGIMRLQRAPAFDAPSARWPFAITRSQAGIEAIFADSMESRGLEIERPVVPTSLEVSENQELLEDPSEYPVKVVLKSAGCSDDASEVVQARFVIGADGAHSWVRKTLGISMTGEESEFIWGVIDIVPDTDFPDARNLCVVHSHAGSALLIPRERDMLRLYIQLSNADVVDPETGRVDRQRASPQKILAIAQKILKPYHMNAAGEFDWWTMYIVGQRCAEAYSRHERVFIAGDACHTHSPKGGQGMNASMGDTHNLAWKLAYVVRGWARMALLKTYELERLTFAKTLIEFDRKFAAVFSGKHTPDISHEELHNMFLENGEYVSGVELQYAVSPVVVNDHQAVASKLSIGKRMIPHVFIGAADAVPVDIQDKLPADLRFKVLVFVGDITDKDVANKLQKLTEKLQEPDGFLGRYDHAGKVFDLLGISASSKDAVDYTDFPQLLRSHWSKILLDDRDMHARVGGGGFQAYGIDPRVGAIVVVRPDGHVGLVAPFDRPDVVDAYFGGFMLPIAAAAQAS